MAGVGGDGSGGNASNGSVSNASDGERWRAADEASLTRLLPTSCCAAQFLTGHGLVPVCSLGVGDPCLLEYVALMTRGECVAGPHRMSAT